FSLKSVHPDDAVTSANIEGFLRLGHLLHGAVIGVLVGRHRFGAAKMPHRGTGKYLLNTQRQCRDRDDRPNAPSSRVGNQCAHSWPKLWTPCPHLDTPAPPRWM